MGIKDIISFLEVVSQISSFFLISFEGIFQKKPSTTTQDCPDVLPEIPSHVWEYLNYWVIPETSGLPEIPDDFGHCPPED